MQIRYVFRIKIFGSVLLSLCFKIKIAQNGTGGEKRGKEREKRERGGERGRMRHFISILVRKY